MLLGPLLRPSLSVSELAPELNCAVRHVPSAGKLGNSELRCCSLVSAEMISELVRAQKSVPPLSSSVELRSADVVLSSNPPIARSHFSDSPIIDFYLNGVKGNHADMAKVQEH